MRHEKQDSLLERLRDETRRKMRALEDKHVGELSRLWAEHRRNIESIIMSVYRQDFGRGTWNAAQANAKGTLNRISNAVLAELQAFRYRAGALIKKSLDTHREEETLRSLWMLDQATPPSFRVSIPQRTVREAKDAPGDYAAGWPDALDNWLMAFRDSLSANLRMEALHEGSIHDAADEASATKIDGFDPDYKFSQLLSSEIIQAQQSARSDIFNANEGLIADEVWLTMEDETVCEECGENDGKPLDEIGDEPPAHFNCRCTSAVVPKPWADMLASGNADEKAAAIAMEELNMVPSAIVVMGRDGSLVGTVSVSFETWKKNMLPTITGAYLGSR